MMQPQSLLTMPMPHAYAGRPLELRGPVATAVVIASVALITAIALAFAVIASRCHHQLRSCIRRCLRRGRQPAVEAPAPVEPQDQPEEARRDDPPVDDTPVASSVGPPQIHVGAECIICGADYTPGSGVRIAVLSCGHACVCEKECSQRLLDAGAACPLCRAAGVRQASTIVL
mmetsp:Transcript_74681/g.211268  ORF Transcript_74681/g.211268 Transcript_74681/m.211268 type:complete len:173 (-) Transcript_74681:55-573(-)